MGYVVYYAITVVLNILILIFFRAHINLTGASAVPLFLLGLSIFQSAYFKKNRGKYDFNTNNTTDLSDSEWETLSIYMSRSYLVCIPLFLPTVFFFSTLLKTVLSVLVFLIAFTAGAIFFRWRYSKSFQERMKQESNELEEQKKKESLGKFK